MGFRFGLHKEPELEVVHHYQTVEIEAPASLPGLHDPETPQAVAALNAHPGFMFLMAKLKMQRSLIESKLKHERHHDIREVDNLQSGIFWTRWLEDQVNNAVFSLSKPKPRLVDPSDEEIFEKARKAVEVVGR